MTDKKQHIYFVDDDSIACRLFERACEKLEYDCTVFSNATDCLTGLSNQLPDIVLTDLNMPEMDGFELIQQSSERWPNLPVVALTGQSSVERAVRAMRMGACDFLQKPYEMPELQEVIERHIRIADMSAPVRNSELVDYSTFGMVGESASMIRTFKMIQKLSEVDCSVVISGESGSGKELAARAIHDAGSRKNEPFVAIDCGSLPDTLLESELFGHMKGAFTGATQNREGLFAAAGHGTIFLDEIGNISSAMQAKLLRVCQENIVTPVGSNKEIPIHARFIVASNRNLAEMVQREEFRHDLYHRLNVITLAMPKLSQRRDDIPLLISHFVKEFSERHQRPEKSFSAQAMLNLQQREWPGNIRELRNFVERCIIMAEGDFLDDGIVDIEKPGDSFAGSVSSLDDSSQNMSLSELEEAHIRRVLDSVDGNQLQAAKILGISRTTLWRKLNNE